MTLGTIDAVTVIAVRKKAKETRAEVDIGGNPKESTQVRLDTDKEVRTIPTLNQLSLRYLNDYTLLKNPSLNRMFTGFVAVAL